MYESHSGTMTLYEGNGTRVLRMVTGDFMIADYVLLTIDSVPWDHSQR